MASLDERMRDDLVDAGFPAQIDQGGGDQLEPAGLGEPLVEVGRARRCWALKGQRKLVSQTEGLSGARRAVEDEVQSTRQRRRRTRYGHAEDHLERLRSRDLEQGAEP